MFVNFSMSDFENLDKTKTESELTSTIKKLKDLKKELEEEILERWGETFKSNIGGLFPRGDKKIDRIWIAFTQREGRDSYIPYPQLNIEISETEFTVFFLLFGYDSPKLLNEKNHFISSNFNYLFVTNVRNNLEELNSHEISINDSDLEFIEDRFDKIFSYEPSEITKLEKSELIDLIFSDWNKLLPLYEMAITVSYNFVDKETIPPLSEVSPKFISLSPIEIAEKGSNKSDGHKRKKPDYGEENERNRKIGERGESLVLRLEQEYLKKIGRIDLIDKIKHISIEDDSAGYDILSFDEKGNEKYIEVKSTTLKVPNVHQFNISSNEYEKARDLKNYFIYFVFKTNTKNPKIFQLKRPFDLSESIIKVIPSNYDVKIGLHQ